MTHEAHHSVATPRMSGRLRSVLVKGALLALAISVGTLPMSSTAFAVAGNDSGSGEVTPGVRTYGEPELANCGTIYGLRLERPHNVERIDPVSGDSTVLFSMGDSVRQLNGLALDRNTKTFWAVQQNGTGKPGTTTTPSVFSYDTRTNTEKSYTGAKLLTPQPREGIVAGAFNPSSNIFYYGQLHDNSFYVYGFDAEAQQAIPGIVAIIEVGQYTNGDFAFDSAGRLYIAADGMLLVTQSALPATGSEDPPRMVARGIAKLSDSPLAPALSAVTGLSMSPTQEAPCSR
ncbi:hypothetical protein G7067_00725 [Leucobacter insecticola]|uniref:SMP-30/Gluconolactonase/LRE-like region domain-containing protein n=1 Tax=Leucobacter insecticola TaxID=2714934 RepID=A0A6G8FG00_9MICO|nr:hypothetical protein [Leucobacter insecticola]QIM15274.1 hypothetical protein G7067_00725 [Leucobacter insecticola]